MERIEWWDFGACSYNPNKGEECNGISSTCADYIQDYIAGKIYLYKETFMVILCLLEIRCSPQLYPWHVELPMNTMPPGSRNTTIGTYRLTDVPICTDWCNEFYK